MNSLTDNNGAKGLLLALETSGLRGSIAVARVNSGEPLELLAAFQLPSTQRSAKSLAPSIRDLLENIRVLPSELACVAVTAGPGSFTGLRVGVTTAKTLAYATGAQLIGVNTLATLAEPYLASNRQPVWVAIDAQRGELFSARVEDPHVDGIVIERHECSEFIDSLPEDALLVSPLAGSLNKVAEEIGKQIQGIVAEPSAESVARVAASAWIDGRTNDLFALTPDYLRPSAAEENYRPWR